MWKQQTGHLVRGHNFSGCEPAQIKANNFLIGWNCPSPLLANAADPCVGFHPQSVNTDFWPPTVSHRQNCEGLNER
jgi:hypothetical protein